MRWGTKLALMTGGALAVALFAVPGEARMAACAVGQKVQTPGGSGVVVAVQNGGVGCTVRSDRWGTTDVYSAFMLDLIGAPPARTPPAAAAREPGSNRGAAVAGDYQCYGGTAGNLKLRFGPGNRYANAQGAAGSYRVRPSGQLEFVSGPWKGYFAGTLPGGRIGLTSVADGTFYQMTCDRR